jgi:hypothetical protein
MSEPRQRLADGVHWAVEDTGIFVIRHGAGRVDLIDYPRAAVWDLLQRGYDRQRILSMLAAITGTDAAAAGRLLDGCVEDWCRRGLLKEFDANAAP